MKKLELEAAQAGKSEAGSSSTLAKVPKLPPFDDNKDDLDSYLQRFERFATINKWEKGVWATFLCTLLTGRAMEVYSRLSDSDAADYDALKAALLDRYDLNAEGYRRRFRKGKPDITESPKQFLVRLGTLVEKWVGSAGATDVQSVLELLVREQFFEVCPRDLAVHLQEQTPSSVEELAEVADRFLVAHGRKLAEGPKVSDKRKVDVQAQSSQPLNHPVQCHNCSRFGHKSQDCKIPKRRCIKCDKLGHISRFCSSSTVKPELSRKSIGASARHNEDRIEDKIDTSDLDDEDLEVVTGYVGDRKVKVLKDSGCSGIVVNENLVKPEEFVGTHANLILMNGTRVEVQRVKIKVDTPYVCGVVKAYSMKDCIYDLIVGSPKSVDKCIYQPDGIAAVTTRAQAAASKKSVSPLKVKEISDMNVDREDVVRLQTEDKSLQSVLKKVGSTEVDTKEWFRLKHDVVYRFSRDTRGGILKQLVLPQSLRKRVMEQAHSSILGGHLGIAKTSDRILSCFYWPGLREDVARYCKSCDVCQKTVPKGKGGKVPLQKMPLMDTPFKRVAVDLVGPIHPPSEAGHRYVLTLVDYATRYPEAVPLKNIDTETVAEALVDFFSRLGVPEEVLSDMGTQFVSACMKEVGRLLNIKQLVTTPYHPMCNGLVEKFNGTLKQMLKRLCCEQPKQWHRYINALLFAYREVPQESSGFSPFELLYGRTVRGPMHILRELWTSENTDAEVMNTYQYVFELREKLEHTLQLARENLERSQSRHKHYYDRTARKKSLRPGDQVLILLPTDSNKLLMQWKGPFKIIDKVGMNDYAVIVSGKKKIFHANLLKQYHSDVKPDSGVLDKVGCSVVELVDDDEAEILDDIPEIGCYSPKESWKDVKYGDDLTGDRKAELLSLVEKFSDVFTDQPGCTNLIEHEIKVTSNDPVRSSPYVVPFAVRDSLKKDIEEMLQMGVIRRSNSSYASPVVVVKKPDGSDRVCIDYRKLNKITLFDPEPMRSISEVFHRLSRAKYFTKIDLSKGYWQIPVAAKDIEKTAFVTPDGAYEFLKMPFGMMNSGATLVRAMRQLIDGIPGVDSYVDDLIVYSTSWEEHVSTLSKLILRMQQAGLTARPSKCLFGSSRVEFVGHVLHHGSVSPQEQNVEKIKTAPRPKTKKEVRSFLGLVGFYREYIPNFAAIAVPLTDLTKKGQPNRIVWSDATESAYRNLKSKVMQKPILKLPDQSKPYVLRTDASDVGLGAVLMQETDGKLFPVSFASKKLNGAQQKYSAIEKECLALVWAVKKYQPYLYGTRFVLQTDHQPLTYLNQARFINNRVMRWSMFLQGHSIKIESIKGCDNFGADFMSRVVGEENL